MFVAGDLFEPSPVRSIGEDGEQFRVPGLGHLLQKSASPVPVLNSGSDHHHRQDQFEGVDEEVSLASMIFLPPSYPQHRPFFPPPGPISCPRWRRSGAPGDPL